MAYQFEILGWKDNQGEAFDGTPPNLSDTFGLKVHLINPGQEGDQHHFWVYTPGALDTWDDWYDLIDAVAADHGMELV